MKSIFTLTNKHSDKKITFNIPRKYSNGLGYDIEKLLKDNNADCLADMSGSENCPENCEIGYDVHDLDYPTISIDDKVVS